MRATAFQIGIPLLLLALALVVMVVMSRRATMAEQRARLALRDLLTDVEFQQLADRGYLEIASPSVQQRVYRIPRAGGRVQVYERERLICELCLRPARALPESDILMIHKLMIEGDEKDYLATANHFASSAADAHAGPPVFWHM